MKQLQGIEGRLSINDLTKVSDLIYFDGPLLSHYVHKSGENYLSYWVDCDDKFQRWLVFKVGITSLQQYVDKRLSLFNVISQLDDGFVYLIDIDECGNATQPTIIFLDQLPDDYFPYEDSYYDFSLERASDVKSLSLANNSGLFEIHFTGADVKYGNMPFDKYTKCLQKIEDLRHCCASSYITKVKTSESYKKLKTKDRSKLLKELCLNTNFQYVYSLAGSVRVLLRPQNLQSSFEQTSADAFAAELIRLFKSGFDVEKLREYAIEYGQDALIKFNELLKILLKCNINLELTWTNANQNIYVRQSINKTENKQILTNLSLSIENVQEETLKGRFYLLNTKTGTFAFEVSDDRNLKINGRFDESIIDVIQTLSFEQIYEITVEKKVLKSLTNTNKITNTIVELNSI